MGVVMLMIASVVTRPHGLALLNSMPAFSMQMPAAAHREVEQRGKERQGCDAGMHGKAFRVGQYRQSS